jgi:hypothetical protein
MRGLSAYPRGPFRAAQDHLGRLAGDALTVSKEKTSARGLFGSAADTNVLLYELTAFKQTNKSIEWRQCNNHCR